VLNAVDPASAHALVDAYDRDDTAAIAVSCEEVVDLCAGADLHPMPAGINKWKLTCDSRMGPPGPAR